MINKLNTHKKYRHLSHYRSVKNTHKNYNCRVGAEEGRISTSTVQGQRQWASIWRLRKTPLEKYYLRLANILSIAIRSVGNIQLAEQKEIVCRKLQEMVLLEVDRGRPDEQIYQLLAKGFRFPKPQHKGSRKRIQKRVVKGGWSCPYNHFYEASYLNKEMSGGVKIKREEHRVKRFMEILKDNTSGIHNLLDVGCSQGKITQTLGQSLKLDASNIHGCDLLDPEKIDTRGFQYTQNQTNSLPYPDQHFGLVVCAMSMHHFSDPVMFSEIARVCKQGGLLLIREHDCRSSDQPWLNVVLDIMHGMWSLVWPVVKGEPPEDPHFCGDYWAHYRGRDDWIRLLNLHGFNPIDESRDRDEGRGDHRQNPMNVYHMLFSKGSQIVGREEIVKDEKIEGDKIDQTVFKKLTAREKFPKWVLDEYHNRTKDPEVVNYLPNYNNIRTAGKTSTYSSLLPKHVNSLCKVLDGWKEKLGKVQNIIDATAHIGCDSIFFSKYFEETSTITSIELEADVYALLVENISRNGLEDRVQPKLGSCLDVIRNIPRGRSVDLLYLDPPWGGRNYRDQKEMTLELDGKPVMDIINGWLQDGKTRAILYKTPNNINKSEIIHSTPVGWSVEEKEIYDLSRSKASFLLWLFYKK